MTRQDQTQKFSSGIAALVLAAGSSQRMGTPKQLLRLGEKTLLERILAHVRAAKVGEIVLVLGHAAEEIQQNIPSSGIRILINENYREGMGTSLRVGISALNPHAAGALVILADQPFVRAATLDGMIEFHRKSSAQIVIPIYRGFRGNPILLDRSVFPELMNLKGDIGCRAIFGSHTQGIQKFAVDDPGILLDIDTVEDFQKLQTLPESAPISDLLPKSDLETAPDPGIQESASRPELVIVGRGPVVTALIRIGHVLRFTTTVVDPFLTLRELPEANRMLHRLDFSLLPKNPEQYIVIASRGQFDEDALEQAFATDAPYIALMANSARREELLALLAKRGVSREKLTRLHAPAGLEIGAATPEEIALSIMAEIVMDRRAKTNAHT